MSSDNPLSGFIVTEDHNCEWNSWKPVDESQSSKTEDLFFCIYVAPR